MKCIKVPGCLCDPPHNNNTLRLNGLSVVESCTHTHKKTGSMFLEEHLLLFVKKGTNTMTHGKTQYIIRSGEMLLMKKATLVNYCKEGDPALDNVYDSMMFFLKDEFLKDFMKMANIQSSYTEEQVKITVKPVKERLLRFFDSIIPYFNEPENIDGGLIKLKMLELLYDISGTDKNLLQQILQLKQPVKTELSTLMEEQFTNPVSLSELAYLSGRSLSSFKRDFQATYNMPPSEWIRNRRLEKALELLKSTSLTVTDICYTTGFENIAHFSRIFRERYGYTASSLRQKEPAALA